MQVFCPYIVSSWHGKWIIFVGKLNDPKNAHVLAEALPEQVSGIMSIVIIWCINCRHANYEDKVSMEPLIKYMSSRYIFLVNEVFWRKAESLSIFAWARHFHGSFYESLNYVFNLKRDDIQYVVM